MIQSPEWVESTTVAFTLTRCAAVPRRLQLIDFIIVFFLLLAECGDFVPEDYPDHSYLSGYKFFPGQDYESERRIMENHKKHMYV